MLPAAISGLTVRVRAVATSIRLEPQVTPLSALRPTLPLPDVVVHDGAHVVCRPDVVERWPERLRGLVVRAADVRRDGDAAALDLEAMGD